MYEEFAGRLKQMSNDQLIDAFNHEVSGSGSGAGRVAYLSALREEFNNRGFNCSAITNESGGFDYAHKISLNGDMVVLEMGAENKHGRSVAFDEDELRKILMVVDRFTSSGISENPPKFVVFMGGVGSGKTTLRKQDFANGYVHFEFGEIVNAATAEFGKDNTKLSSYASLASNMILQESIDGRKNIVTEIIGNNEETFKPVIDKMKDIGYEVSIKSISCEPEEAYKRHLKAVKEDPAYLSAYFTQEATLSFFYRRLGLGAMPVVGA